MGINPSKEHSEKNEEIDNPELAGFRVELPQTASFNDLIERIKLEHGEEAARKTEEEIDWQTQQIENLDKSSSIFDVYEKEGHSQESIGYWLPIKFKK